MSSKLKSYETPSSISSSEYCTRLGGLNKLYPFGGSRSVATVIGNVEHSSFQEYYNLMHLDCCKYKTKIFKTSEYHQKRLEKVTEYIEQSFKILYPSFYQHIIDEIPSIKWRLEKHYHQKIGEIQSLNKKLTFEKAVSIALPFAIVRPTI